ncbi:hypothetical protein D3C84_690740 [compost metagenome]
MAQGGNQDTGINDFFEFLGEGGQHRCQWTLPRADKKQQLQGKTDGQHRSQHRGQCEGTSAQAAFRHAVNAQPGQPPFREPAAQRPDDQGQQQQHGREQALTGLPDGLEDISRLFDEKAQALPVVRRWGQ